jgi:carbon-monoxide dehydrogenase small subunit
MILSGKSLFNKNPNPTRDEIKTAIEGNLCRCTGYTKIVEAIEKAVKK